MIRVAFGWNSITLKIWPVQERERAGGGGGLTMFVGMIPNQTENFKGTGHYWYQLITTVVSPQKLLCNEQWRVINSVKHIGWETVPCVDEIRRLNAHSSFKHSNISYSSLKPFLVISFIMTLANSMTNQVQIFTGHCYLCTKWEYWPVFTKLKVSSVTHGSFKKS